MNSEALNAVIALVELGPRRKAEGTKWCTAAMKVCPFCADGEDVSEASGRLLLERVRELEAYANRLEEAGDKMHWAFMHPFDTAHESVPDAWRKAKESKP